ncbi:MAG: glutathione S-transferase family protein, partial [Maricaulaceae bacterium]
MALEFFSNPRSRGRIVHWLLEEIGQPYETRWIAYGPDAHKGADYRAINPMGKFPAIRHDGRVVTETPAICVYLADVFPDAGLGPTTEEKANYFRWLFFAAGPLEQAQTAHGLGWEVPGEHKGAVGFGSRDETIGALEGLLASRDYVCGGRFTAADVYLGARVAWELAGGLLPDAPAFTGY